jgi:uncharacterized membrane protein
VRTDLSEPGRPHDEIALQWSSRSRILPDFRGTVRFRIAGSGTRLVLDGEYVPPGGRIGGLFDTLVGRHVARATLRDFAGRLADELARCEREWRAAQ